MQFDWAKIKNKSVKDAPLLWKDLKKNEFWKMSQLRFIVKNNLKVFRHRNVIKSTASNPKFVNIILNEIFLANASYNIHIA